MAAVLGSISYLQVLIDFILCEAREAGEAGRTTVQARLPLLLRCLPTRPKLTTVVEHLVQQASQDQARDLLTELYMAVPGALQEPYHPLAPNSCPLQVPCLLLLL